MRVLIFTQYFWPENFHINAIARNLHSVGVLVTVLTGKPNYPEGKIFEGYSQLGIQEDEYCGFEIIRVPMIQRGKNSAKGLLLNYLSFILSGYLFAPYSLRGKKFDAIFVYAPSPLLQALPAIYMSWLKKAPLILWVQDIWPEALVSTGFVKSPLILKIVKLAVRYIYCFSDSILIQSEGFRKSVESLTKKIEKIHFFPNSAEVTGLNATMPEETVRLSAEIASHFSVVFAGNIGAAQSCETIIDAAQLLSDRQKIKFYLIGTGSRVEQIKSYIRAKKLDNVVMTGRLSAEDMSSVFTSASVLLLTLTNDLAVSSTIPSKLQSYLAAGKPIIASCDGEAAFLVEKAKAGLTCRASDAAELADAVKTLSEMTSDERDSLGKNGSDYFKMNFCLQSRTAELISHFSDTLELYKNSS